MTSNLSLDLNSFQPAFANTFWMHAHTLKSYFSFFVLCPQREELSSFCKKLKDMLCIARDTSEKTLFCTPLSVHKLFSMLQLHVAGGCNQRVPRPRPQPHIHILIRIYPDVNVCIYRCQCALTVIIRGLIRVLTRRSKCR